MLHFVRPATVMTILFTLLLGLAYPLAMTGVGQIAFPAAANGSLVRRDGTVVGSALIGQGFTSARYDGMASSGSNLGPTSQKLKDRTAASIATLRATGIAGPLPADAATASGSGLDPDISPAYAKAQVARVAAARGLEQGQVMSLVEQHIDPPAFGFMGEARVNVLSLNLALDALASAG
jgi:K+-transporting ATPase ATPase C chain